MNMSCFKSIIRPLLIKMNSNVGWKKAKEPVSDQSSHATGTFRVANFHFSITLSKMKKTPPALANFNRAPMPTHLVWVVTGWTEYGDETTDGFIYFTEAE